MAGIGQFWSNLDPKQRMLIAVGIPAVAFAAIYSARKGKGPTSAEAQGTNITVTGAPLFETDASGSESFSLYRDLQNWMESARSNGVDNQTVPNADANPCTPGAGFNPSACGTGQLVSACIASNGNSQILAELWNRQYSFNSPEIAGTQCGRAYALYGISRGAIPTAENYGRPVA